MPDEKERAQIVVTHLDGVRFAAQVRSHRVIVDQPRDAGGEDTGPMPIELLGTSLGTCVAFYVQQFLGARHLPYEGLRVEVEQTSARNPNRVGEFAVRVILPAALPLGYSEMLERVVISCPAHNTLDRSAQVRFAIQSRASAGT
ncbi:MAG: OsmC family protein [Gemmatimonadaceae bacterium]